jgi:tetratricopeptide (TPR) repeat protein
MEHPDQIRFRALKLIESGQHAAAIPILDQLIDTSEHPGDYAWRAQSLVALGLYQDALNDCENAMDRDDSDPSAFLTAAFIRAASPIAELRNGRTALKLLDHAIDKMDRAPNWRIYSVMAAVYAENGDFTAAQQHANQSLSDAPPEFVERFRQRIQQYRDGIPYRATIENNVSSFEIREDKCTICGKPAFMRWPPRDPERKPRCVACCSYDTSKSAE